MSALLVLESGREPKAVEAGAVEGLKVDAKAVSSSEALKVMAHFASRSKFDAAMRSRGVGRVA